MVLSIKTQMIRLIRQAALEMRRYQKEIDEEWNQFLIRMPHHSAITKISPDEENLLKQFNRLFWSYLPQFCADDSDVVFTRLQNDWKNQHLHPIHTNKLIIIFTIIEQLTHKVINKEQEASVQTHQAIQHFFSEIVLHLLVTPGKQALNTEEMVHRLLNDEQNPILWIAKVTQNDNAYVIEHFESSSKLPVDETWVRMVSTLQAPSLELLSDAILRLVNGSHQSPGIEVYPYPYKDQWYLFCLTGAEAQITSYVLRHFLESIGDNEEAFETLQVKNDWKDSLILFDEWIMLARNFQEAVEKVVSGFTKYLPFQRAGLFYYAKSDNGEDIGIGVIGHQIATKEIRSIRENLNNFPQIKEMLTYIQPLYLPKADSVLPNRLVAQFQLESLVITPVYSAFNNHVLGAVFLDQGEGETFSISNAMLSVITKFGQHAGELLAKYSPTREHMSSITNKYTLTEREIGILQLIANGKTIEETADILYLSRYTVRDYISTIKKKLNAQNRPQAIAEAMRRGFI